MSTNRSPLFLNATTGTQKVLGVDDTIVLNFTSVTGSPMVLQVGGVDTFSFFRTGELRLASNVIWNADSGGSIGAVSATRPATVNATTEVAAGAVTAVGTGTRLFANTLVLGHGDVDKQINCVGIVGPAGTPAIRYNATTHLWQCTNDGVVWYSVGETISWDALYATDKALDINDTGIIWTQTGVNKGVAFTVDQSAPFSTNPLVVFSGTGDHPVLRINNKTTTYAETIDLAATVVASQGVVVNVNGNTLTNSGLEIYNATAGSSIWRCTLAGNHLWGTDGTGAIGTQYTGRPATVNVATTLAIGAVTAVGDGTRVGLNNLYLGHSDVPKYIYADQTGAPYPGLRYESVGNTWQFSNNGTVWNDIASAFSTTWDAVYAIDKTLDINAAGLVWTQTGANKGVAFTVTRALTSAQTSDVLVHFQGTGDQSVFKITNATDQPGMLLPLDATAPSATGFQLRYTGHVSTTKAFEIWDAGGAASSWYLDIAGNMIWGTDGSGDIGTVDDFRPNYIYAKTGVTVGATPAADGTRVALNSITLGHADVDKYLYADQGGANDPALGYDTTDDQWRCTNDGTNWFDIGTGVIYTTLREGIQKTDVGGVFYVQPDASTTNARFVEVLSQAAPAGIVGDIDTGICTDGTMVFYRYTGADTHHHVIAIRNDTGATVWDYDSGGTALTTNLCTDGSRVYFGAAGTVYSRRSSDGLDPQSDAMLSGNATIVACNGTYLLASSDEGDPGGHVSVFTVAAGVPTYARAVHHDEVIESVFCGDTFGILGGVSVAGTEFVRIFTLATGAVTAEYLDTWWDNPPGCHGIYFDGDYVYIATMDVSEAAGGNHSCCWKMLQAVAANPADTIVAWEKARGAGAVDGSGVCGDDRYIYFTTIGVDSAVLDKSTMATIQLPTIISLIATDGLYIYVPDNSGGTKYIKGYSLGYSTRCFVRVDPTDPRRFPIQGMLAIPLW